MGRGPDLKKRQSKEPIRIIYSYCQKPGCTEHVLHGRKYCCKTHSPFSMLLATCGSAEIGHQTNGSFRFE